MITALRNDELSQSEKNSLEANYEKADNYFYGAGVEQNKEVAIKLYTNLAQAGHAKSQFALGNIYKTSGNFDQAIKWYKMCAEQGWVAAIFKIGETFQEAGNIEEAISNYKLAANLGNVKAKLALEKLKTE